MATGPTVTIYLLGDTECGKKTFLAHLIDAQYKAPEQETRQNLDSLKNPQGFSVQLFNRPYTFEVYRLSHPDDLNSSEAELPEPDLLILTFSVVERQSLVSVRDRWQPLASRTFSHLEDRLPMMLVGLQRDRRNSRSYEQIVLPMEGHDVAQQIGAHSYAECSAMTGELMWEVLEDITKTAARTTTEAGAKGGGPSCAVI